MERNYGLDLLRMLAMFMILILHILAQGGVFGNTGFHTAQNEVAWFLEIAAYGAVNCYALISGYVGVNSNYKYSKFFVLWFRVIFYTIIITCCFRVWKPALVTSDRWIDVFFPVMRGQYWYFTAYFVLFLFMPILNSALNQLSQSVLKILLGIIVFFATVIQIFFKVDCFVFGGGYTGWWLVLLYLIGGYIRKYGLFKRCKTYLFVVGYFCMVIFTWISKNLIESGKFTLLDSQADATILVQYTSFTIFGGSLFLLLAFERLKIGKRVQLIIKKCSPLAFSVYLIHAQPLIWENIMANRFSKYGSMTPVKELICIIGTALLIYVGCSVIDVIRECLFKWLKIRLRLEQLENCVLKS